MDLVLHCHHGGRSQRASEYLVSMGFKNVANLAGGIDAWSVEIDNTIPRYQLRVAWGELYFFVPAELLAPKGSSDSPRNQKNKVLPNDRTRSLL